MALKDFNYKQFFFDHGERIGMGVAGFLTLLLILPLFWPGSGFLSASAGSNAESLDSVAKKVDEGVRTNQPGVDDKPGDPTDKLVAFNFDIIPQNKAREYMVAGMFSPIGPRQSGRQMPQLMQPKESAVALVRFQLPSLMFTTNYDKLWTLKDATSSSGAAPAPGGTGSSAPNGDSISKMYTGSKSGSALAPGSLAAPGAKKIREGLMPGSALADDKSDKSDKDFVMEPIALEKVSGKTLAEQLYPLRAAEIVAAFPYKAQVREFRDKLRLASDAAVLTEPSLETNKEGKVLAAFRFLGVNVQRRQVNAQGAPVGDKEGWTALDIDNTYKPLIVLNGKRLEDEDAKLKPIIFPGLVMRKLVTFGARRTPPVDEYPKLEEEVPSIKATVDALFKTPEAKIAKPSATNVPEDVFNLDATGPGSAPPGGASPTPGGTGPPPGGTMPPTGIAIPGGTAPPGMGTLTDGSKPGQEAAVPDVCLIRLFDVTVEPGKTYEYRIQVRMANPNFGRKDSASQSYADIPELQSKDWYVLPQKVTVPSDLYYYAVDQKDIDAKEPPPKDPMAAKEPKLPIQPVKEGQTVLQIQKWMDLLPSTKVGGVDLPIGDWVVAERVVATRGEPIGRQKAEVPYWRTAANRFTLASDPRQPKTPDGKPKGVVAVDVQFAKDGEEPILVDFSGGDTTYKRVHPKTEDGTPAGDQPLAVQDKAPMEVVLLTADGHLLARSSARDAADPVRVKRLAEARDWIQSVKNTKGGKDSGDSPFPKS